MKRLCDQNPNCFFKKKILSYKFFNEVRNVTQLVKYLESDILEANLLKHPHHVIGQTILNLLQHKKINISLHGIHYSLPKGRLKSDLANCSYVSEKEIKNKAIEWCRYIPDTGFVECNGPYLDNTFHRHRYMVPKRCVQWKTENGHATEVKYSKLQFVAKGT